jgi:16S rRNA (guanine(527)-N(7))-methyltransferase RsmG
MFHVEQFLLKFLPFLNSKQIIGQLSFLEQEYLKWNKAINLSSVRDSMGFWEKHVLDSLCLAHHIHENYPEYDVFDIGSGGGFPGLVLAVCLKNKITMVEPIKKKADFIEHCSLRMKLSNVHVAVSKYEGINVLPKRSLIVSRALGNYDFLYDHFMEIDKGVKIVLMTTKSQKYKFKTQIFTAGYDFINQVTENSFKNHVLAEVVE